MWIDKYEKFCWQLSVYLSKTWFRKTDESLCSDDGAERDRRRQNIPYIVAKSLCSLLLALSWTDTIALNTSFVHLTDEGSDSELDEPPSTIKKKLIISAGDSTVAVMSYVHSSAGRIAGILWTLCEGSRNERSAVKVCSYKTWHCRQTCITVLNNKFNFWFICWWISVCIVPFLVFWSMQSINTFKICFDIL